jgi:hypothetical protein
VGHDPTRLQRHWGQVLHLVALPDNVRGLHQGCGDIATRIERAQGDIRPQLLMHNGSICPQGLQRVDDGRQRRIVHLDQLPGILGQGQLLSHHNSNGLPDVAHLAARQDWVDGRLQCIGFCLAPGRDGFYHPLKVISGDDGDDPRQVAGRRRID